MAVFLSRRGLRRCGQPHVQRLTMATQSCQCGVVYKLTAVGKNAWTFAFLHAFVGGTMEASPSSSLTYCCGSSRDGP